MPASEMSTSYKNNFLPNSFNKVVGLITQKITDLKKIYIFSNYGCYSHHFDYLFTCLGLILKLCINNFQHNVEFAKN